VSQGAKLMLVDCDDPERYDTVWLFDETRGTYMSDMDPDYCWTVNIRTSMVLRLKKCRQVLSSGQFFDFYDKEDDGDYNNSTKGQIRFKNNRCIVHTGTNANVGIDRLIVKECEAINDDNRKEWNLLKPTREENETKDPPMEFSDPFDVDLPYFSGSITKGYSDPDLADFDKDLAGAAAMVLNKAIKRNIDIGNNLYYPPMMMFSKPLMEKAEAVTDQNVASSASSGEEVTDYETNVQEEGVDEADIMKADENNIYASYGDNVLVWDKYGNMKTQLKMPEIVVEGGEDYGMGPYRYSYMYWNPKPRIDSLLLIPGYLVVFVSGYGNAFRKEKLGGRPAILYNYLDTQIRVYSTIAIDEGKLELKAVKNINGRFVDARLVEGKYVHAVTTSDIDTYQHLINPLDRNQYFSGLSDLEYYVAAQEQAREKKSSTIY